MAAARGCEWLVRRGGPESGYRSRRVPRRSMGLGPMRSDRQREVQPDATLAVPDHASASSLPGPEGAPWRDTEGAPAVPAEAREELLALKSGAQFVCTRPDGSIRPSDSSGEGFYAQDTRHLSDL